MLQLAARYAELWNVDRWNNCWPEALRPLRAAVDAACRDVGREPSTLGHTVGIAVHSTGPGIKADGEAHTGTPERLAEIFHSFAREGVCHIQVLFRPNTLASIEAFAPVLELLDRE